MVKPASPEDRLREGRLELLKLEATILSERIGQIVDSLWKIRQFSSTLWVAAVGVGLGAISSTAIPAILAVTSLIPLWAFWIDARYNRWYRRFAAREREIERFLNDEDYIVPGSGEHVTLEDLIRTGDSRFPIFDMSGERTFREDAHFGWNKSLARSFVDTIPLFIYGSEAIGSVVLLALHTNQPWWVWILSMAGPALVLGSVVAVTKCRIRRRSERSNARREHNS